jgi:DNA repair protein RecN (Recombination protein N)
VIEELSIHGLGVIDEAVLELSPGLTVVTGETGAGKTMVVTGLGLLLGGRADPGAARAGADRVLVEGRLRPPAEAQAAARVALLMDEAGADLDDEALLLARAVSVEGRSRAWMGGRSVPVGQLAELAGELVAVHGQSDQLRLLRPAHQREALDRYAGPGLADLLATYAVAFAELGTVEAELAEVTSLAHERAREADALRYGLAEVSAVAPAAGEDATLADEAQRLGHADALRTASATAHAALLGDPESVESVDALAQVVAARRTVEPVREHDPALAALADRLAELATLTAELGSDLAAYADGIDADPGRLAAVEERRAALKHLTRTYGLTVDDVLAWADQAASRLDDLDGDESRVGALTDRRAVLRAQLGTVAADLSAARTAAATSFGTAVTAELADLAMPDATVSVAVSQDDAQEGLEVAGRRVAFGPYGIDRVELLLAAHAGAAPRALGKGASGGELSRVMLAVEVVFAGADPVPTLVFDEVDAGVGGRAAVEVGRRLARLARTAQVLVVTHLPQVAAFADRHLLVEKSSDGAVTRSDVRALDDEGRVAELTRMLAGLEGSESGRAHAEELLAAAAAARDDATPG